MHNGKNIFIFAVISCCQIKLKWTCLPIMTSALFGGQSGMLVSQKTPSQL